MDTSQRQGMLVRPYERLTDAQVRTVDGVSRALLEDPGILSYSPDAAEYFRKAGATVAEADDCLRVRIPANVLDAALASVPSRIVLGARNPDNKLVIDAHEPRVRFATGAEANFWLDVAFESGQPTYTRLPGSIKLLGAAAHLCNQLDSCDAFIRCINIQDPEIDSRNKDVNKFAASLNNITKHVMASLESFEAIDEVVTMGEIIAGGTDAFVANPVLSMITCIVKSPLQIVAETAEKTIGIAKRRIPLVISSSPMGGTTAPFDEFGMVAQINAEILAGIALTQLVSPGTPVLYGSVPVRCRLDNLNDMYAAPEFVHYNLDCAQMARLYGIPCYSSSGIGDASEPGLQATVEKMLTHGLIPFGGAHYIHYSFGLLERTNVFCPVQAVLDDAHVDLVKRSLRPTTVAAERTDEVLGLIREVMATSHRTYVYNLPLPTREPVYVSYPLEDTEQGALHAAYQRYNELAATAPDALPVDVQEEIMTRVPGLFPKAFTPPTEDA